MRRCPVEARHLLEATYLRYWPPAGCTSVWPHEGEQVTFGALKTPCFGVEELDALPAGVTTGDLPSPKPHKGLLS